MPRDRQGGRRRQSPQERKRRAYDELIVWKFHRTEGSRHASDRHQARRVLAGARRERGEALEERAAEVGAVRVRGADFKLRIESRYDHSVSWYATRMIQTVRERVEATFQRRVEWTGTRMLAAMSVRDAWTWRQARASGVDSEDFRERLRSFLRTLVEGTTPYALRLARWLGVLLDDTSGTIAVSPTNRWSGSTLWRRDWLVGWLASEPAQAQALLAWRERIEHAQGATLDAWLAGVERSARRRRYAGATGGSW